MITLYIKHQKVEYWILVSVIHDGLYPSCLQTTWTSLRSHPLSHTVPHSPLMHISTLPSSDVDPFTSRTAPWVHDITTDVIDTGVNINYISLKVIGLFLKLTFLQTSHSYVIIMRIIVRWRWVSTVCQWVLSTSTRQSSEENRTSSSTKVVALKHLHTYSIMILVDISHEVRPLTFAKKR